MSSSEAHAETLAADSPGPGAHKRVGARLGRPTGGADAHATTISEAESSRTPLSKAPPPPRRC